MKKYTNILLSILAILAICMVFGGPEGLSFAVIATFTKTCTKNIAGNSALYVTEAASVDAVTVTSGEITAITMNTTLLFQQVQGDLDSISRTEEGEGSQTNISYTHRVEARFAKPSKAVNTLRNSLADASACGILAIVTDGNGVSWLVGYNEADGVERALYLQTDSVTSGAEPTEEDAQAVTIALECSNGYVALPFESVYGATISGGTAAALINYV